MNKLLRNYIGYRVFLCKEARENMYKNKIKDKCCFEVSKMNKLNFDVLIEDIKSLTNRLSFWIGNCSCEDDSVALPKALNLKSLKVEDLGFFNNDEISEIIDIDKSFSKDIEALNFEREVLVKKKVKSLKMLEIDKAISYVKLIDNLDIRLNLIKSNIEKVEDVYREKNSIYLSVYNQFVSEFDSPIDNLKDMYKNSKYDRQVVRLYRINKIVDMIVEVCPSECFYDLFENQNIKDLLGCDYFLIKQKVNNYVGANS